MCASKWVRISEISCLLHYIHYPSAHKKLRRPQTLFANSRPVPVRRNYNPVSKNYGPVRKNHEMRHFADKNTYNEAIFDLREKVGKNHFCLVYFLSA